MSLFFKTFYPSHLQSNAQQKTWELILEAREAFKPDRQSSEGCGLALAI
jgi:hypothetical protein